MNRLLKAKLEIEKIREKGLLKSIQELEKQNRRKIEDLSMFIERFFIQHEIVKAEDLMTALTVEEGLKYYKQYHIYYESKEALLSYLLQEQFSKMNKELLSTFNDSLFQSISKSSFYLEYELDKHFLNHSSISSFNQIELEDLLKTPFLNNHYSKRLENFTKTLAEDTLNTLKESLQEANTIKQTVKQCKDYLQEQDYQLKRLMITEESFYFNQTTHELYKLNAIEYYQILSTLDTHTSTICIEQDSKVYRVDEAETGINKPPFHANCRSTDIPYIKGLTDSERAFKLDDNKTQITDDMTYQEWFNKFYRKN